MNEQINQQFWKNINKTNFCWNWMGYLSKRGQPIIRSDREYSCRRLAVTLSGKEIGRSSRVLTWCHNKICLNPDHLVYDDKTRFWVKVQKLDDDDCWIWIGAQDKDMYGKFTLSNNGKRIDIKAHRYSWQLFTISDSIKPTTSSRWMNASANYF